MKIFLSTRGKLNDVSRNLQEFLKYVENTTDEFAGQTDSQLVKDMHRRVQDILDTRKYQVEYMTLYQYEKDIERQARASGLEEGQLNTRRETALRLHTLGIDIATIAAGVDVSIEQAKAWIEEDRQSE